MIQQPTSAGEESSSLRDAHVEPSATPASDPHVGFRSVLANGAFSRLWTAQILSQVAQNTVFASMLAQIQLVTRSSTNVVFVIVCGLLPQVLLSSFAGILVDRASKRTVLMASNLLRMLCVFGYLSFQTTPWVLFTMVFLSQAIGQFFAPAEAAAIPILVRREGLMAATSLFNLSFNVAQVVPFGLGLLLLSFIGLSTLLLIVIALFALAAILVATLPNRTAVRPPRRSTTSLADEVRRVGHDFGEGVRFIVHDGALRLALFQINITPTVMFLFGVLGAGYVQRVIHLRPDNLYVLLVPAGLGLLIGTWGLGQFGGRIRKEKLIHWGIFALGAAVIAMGVLPPIIRAFHDTTHLIPVRPYQALTYPAMAIAVVVGLAMALTTVPTQTIVFERAAPEMRGRVLAMQQWLGGAVPLLPLLVVGPLVDAIGVASVLVGIGVVILLAGWYSVRVDLRRRLSLANQLMAQPLHVTS
ncbi:MAG: major facilitator superfamily 1 [Chloroflexi bacterium]|nr:major facilitator superfamily 1 [Chloroflexota bacterium]